MADIHTEMATCALKAVFVLTAMSLYLYAYV
jgi:hypothetical protein